MGDDTKRHLLLLRGLAREQRHWGPFPERLRAGLGAEVHCLDLPGVGTEHRRSSPSTIAEITEDLRARWRTLRWEHPGSWTLMGVSLGGMITMQWGATYPEDFGHVVVVNSSTRDLSHPLRRLQRDVVPQLVRSIFDPDPVRRERRVLGFTTRLATNRDELARQWAAYAQENPIKRRTVLRQIAAAATFRAPEEIPVRTLILAGGEDALADPECALRLARHLRAPLHLHPEAGHDLCTDAPEWVIRQLANFLEST